MSRGREPDREGRRPASREPIKSYATILREEIGVATAELRRPLPALAGSGLLAGITIGTTVLALVIITSTLGEDAHPLLERFLVGNAYAMGFALVIFARADLFTEYTTIAILPVLLGRAGLSALARLWGVIYGTNLVGALAIAAFLVPLVDGLHGAGSWAFLEVGRDLTRASAGTMLLSAGLAGWLMGLLSWLVVAARETVSQLLFVWIVGALIGFAGLHHCITGAAEVAAAVIAGDVSLRRAGHFLLWATLGNVVGSVLFALAIRVGVIHRHESGEGDASVGHSP